MPTLKEFRATLRRGIGNIVVRDITNATRTKFENLESTLRDELPDDEEEDVSSKTGLDIDALRKAKFSPPKFTISIGGKDAIVHFGEYTGLPLSVIYERNPSYMAWLIKTFSKAIDAKSSEFVDIVKYVVKSKGP